MSYKIIGEKFLAIINPSKHSGGGKFLPELKADRILCFEALNRRDAEAIIKEHLEREFGQEVRSYYSSIEIIEIATAERFPLEAWRNAWNVEQAEKYKAEEEADARQLYEQLKVRFEGK